MFSANGNSCCCTIEQLHSGKNPGGKFLATGLSDKLKKIVPQYVLRTQTQAPRCDYVARYSQL